LGGLFAGIGLVALGAGAVLWRTALEANSTAVNTTEYGTFAERRADAEQKWRWGVTGVAVGSALVVAAVARTISVAFDPRPGHRAVAVGGSF
jgi:hypothetical protein